MIPLAWMKDVRSKIAECRLCEAEFARSATAHCPRPVVWFAPGARILVAGQAPGMKVHKSGKPFTDPSGDRLRKWMDVSEEVFYDRNRMAIVPMAFCFPGYSAKGSDLPPPAICARTWRADVLAMLPDIRLTLVIGGHAMKYHLGQKLPVTEAVRRLQDVQAGIFVLPHPSWRNSGWLKKNPWFEADVLPTLQASIRDVLND